MPDPTIGPPVHPQLRALLTEEGPTYDEVKAQQTPANETRYVFDAAKDIVHMDVTHHTMCRWTTRGQERMTLPNARPRESHFEGRLMHDAACKAWLSTFIDHWLSPPAQAVGAQRRVSKVSTR